MTNSCGSDETDMDDLVVRAKTQREAFGTLYDRFFPMLHRYCRRRLFDAAAADDASSETFLQIARAMHRFPGRTEKDFRRWLYRIATNVINAQLRKNARRAELFNHALSQGWWASASAVDDSREPVAADWEVAVGALRHLSQRDQTILTLRFMEGLSYEEVAEVLNARSSTVRVAAGRAIQSLRRRLSNQLAPRARQQKE